MIHLRLPALFLICGFLLTPVVLRAEPGVKFPPLSPEAIQKIKDAVPSTAPAHPSKPRRLLVFFRTEGYVHASIPYGIEALRQIGGKTRAFTIEASDDMAVFDPKTLAKFDGVVFLSSTLLKFDDPANRKALLDFVASGKGLIGIHAGIDNFPTWPEAKELMGGAFQSHPWKSGDVSAVKNDDPKHPINAAFQEKGFWIKDEIYQIVGPYGRDKQRVLLSLDMSKPQNARPADQLVRTDNDYPISWIKKLPSGGRVFYCSLGHNEEIYSNPAVLRHYLAGIQFALGDLDVDATPSAKMAVKPTAALAEGLPVDR